VSAVRDAYIHAELPGAAGGPILFLFHGTGGNETQFLKLGRDLLAEARLVAPRGDVSEGGALRFFRRRAEGVYDMEDLAWATAKMAAFVEAHVATAAPSRVLGLGYSNGANILAGTIFARPGLFDAAVLMHPLIPWTPPPAPVAGRVLITAGRRDPIAPVAAIEALAAWFRDQGAEAELHWHAGGHEIARSEIETARDFLMAALPRAKR
jgi:phospholipase/carboxylesterase